MFVFSRALFFFGLRCLGQQLVFAVDRIQLALAEDKIEAYPPLDVVPIDSDRREQEHNQKLSSAPTDFVFIAWPWAGEGDARLGNHDYAFNDGDDDVAYADSSSSSYDDYNQGYGFYGNAVEDADDYPSPSLMSARDSDYETFLQNAKSWCYKFYDDKHGDDSEYIKCLDIIMFGISGSTDSYDGLDDSLYYYYYESGYYNYGYTNSACEDGNCLHWIPSTRELYYRDEFLKYVDFLCYNLFDDSGEFREAYTDCLCLYTFGERDCYQYDNDDISFYYSGLSFNAETRDPSGNNGEKTVSAEVMNAPCQEYEIPLGILVAWTYFCEIAAAVIFMSPHNTDECTQQLANIISQWSQQQELGKDELPQLKFLRGSRGVDAASVIE